MKKTFYIVISTLVIIGGIVAINMPKADANNYSLSVINNDYFTNTDLENLSCIKVICGLDEYTINNTADISNICNMFSSLILTDYSGDDVYGSTLIKFIKSNGQDFTISISSDLVFINEKCFKMDCNILSEIRKIALKYNF